MEKWKKEILKRSLAEDVIADYHDLLSIGKNNTDAENITIHYYTEHVCKSQTDEIIFWLSLALIQWEWGRLSVNVKEKALFWLMQSDSVIEEETAAELKKCLLSPMRPLKKISKPKWIGKCPWPVGSLLAYRIMSTDYPMVVDGPYWNKYVLLRIVMIKRTPVSRLSPETEWSESMIVGLYDWFGESIPDPAIVTQLKYTPISVRPSAMPIKVLTSLSEEIKRHAGTQARTSIRVNLNAERVETCVSLDWRCAKGIDPNEVFTYLGSDPNFEVGASEYFKTDITQYSISHSIPFDVTLVKRLIQLAEHKTGDGVVSRINSNS